MQSGPSRPSPGDWLPIDLDIGRGSRGFLVRDQTPRSALVFVHGFKGKPTKTWGDFPWLLREHERLAGTDLVFYGYDSRNRVASLAARLAADLEAFGSGDTPPAPRVPVRTYENILLVAHSLGAVVARRALLDGLTKDSVWARKVSHVLFAPAHQGADAMRLLKQGLGQVPFVPAFIQHTFASLLDIESANTPCLSNLRADAKRLVSRYPNASAASVEIAEHENVVDPSRFPIDPPPGDPIKHTDHWSVCKPAREFLGPFEALVPWCPASEDAAQ